MRSFIHLLFASDLGTLSVKYCHTHSTQIQAHKRLQERYLLGQKRNLQIFGVIPLIKLQNDT